MYRLFLYTYIINYSDMIPRCSSIISQTKQFKLTGWIDSQNIYLKLLQLENGNTIKAYEAIINNQFHQNPQMNQCFDNIQEVYEHMKQSEHFSIDFKNKKINLLWLIAKGRSKYLQIGCFDLKQTQINQIQKLQEIHTKCNNNSELSMAQVISWIGFISKSLSQLYKNSQLNKIQNDQQLRKNNKNKQQELQKKQASSQIQLYKIPNNKTKQQQWQNNKILQFQEPKQLSSQNDQNRCQLQKIEQRIKKQQQLITKIQLSLQQVLNQIEQLKFHDKNQNEYKNKLSDRLDDIEKSVPVMVQKIKQISNYKILNNQTSNQIHEINKNNQINIIFLPVEAKNWISFNYQRFDFSFNLNKIWTKRGNQGGCLFGNTKIQNLYTFSLTKRSQNYLQNVKFGIADVRQKSKLQNVVNKIVLEGSSVHDYIDDKCWKNALCMGDNRTLIITIDLKLGRIRWRLQDTIIITQHQALKDSTIVWVPYFQLYKDTSIFVYQPNCKYSMP